MALRKPLVVVSGLKSELPPGDTIEGTSVGTLTAGSGLSGGGSLAVDQRVDVSLAPNPSGLIFVGDALGIDGAAQVTADTALASGNAALLSAATAQASGNAALPRAGGTISGDVTLANQTELRFGEASVNGNNYVGFKASSSIATNLSWTLPSADGTIGQVLNTDGSGTLSWATPSAGLSKAEVYFFSSF